MVSPALTLPSMFSLRLPVTKYCSSPDTTRKGWPLWEAVSRSSRVRTTPSTVAVTVELSRAN